jgi:hypothetical protein
VIQNVECLVIAESVGNSSLQEGVRGHRRSGIVLAV